MTCAFWWNHDIQTW